MEGKLLRWIQAINTRNSVSYNESRMNEMYKTVESIVDLDGTCIWTVDQIKNRYQTTNDAECALFMVGYLQKL